MNISRRSLFLLGLTSGGLALAGCSSNGSSSSEASSSTGGIKPSSTASSFDRIMGTDPAVQETEDKRAGGGKTTTTTLTSDTLALTLAGQKISTIGYGNALPGPVLRSTVGGTISIDQQNKLDDITATHFHGVHLRNNVDGVPFLTQDPIAAGGSLKTTFKTAVPGTYWYHSHVGMQREQGMYGAFIIDDPNEKLKYDQEWVLLLDDWNDGIDGNSPTAELKRLKSMSNMSSSSATPSMDSSQMAGMGESSSGSGDMSGMHMHSDSFTNSDILGGTGGDVAYSLYLVNGKTMSEPDTLSVKAGEKIRLRVINAAGDTAFRVGVPGQKLTITHTDGFAVQQQEVDGFVVAMGERVDALYTVQDASALLAVLAEGKSGGVFGVFDTGDGKSFDEKSLPASIDGTVIDTATCKADDSVKLESKTADVNYDLELTGDMMSYQWAINGKQYTEDDPFSATVLDIKQGQRVQLNFVNKTMMWHPMHLHGHTFQIGEDGPRKDTVIVRQGETVSVFFDADNPGQWLTHCHNAYHAGAGMMAVVSYVK